MPRVVIVIFIAVSVICYATPSHSLDVTVTGTYTESIDATDLISGAGSNLTASYESAADQVIMDISNSLGGGDSWRIDVSKSDISWSASITLYVKRTSDGVGGSVSGGTTYMEITDVDQQLCTGTDDVTGIDLQYKVDDISISIDPGNYDTSIVYTIVDL